MVTKQYGIP